MLAIRTFVRGIKMAPEKSRVWVINKKIVGYPKLDDFTCVERNVPPCSDGGIVIEAEFLSVDPYMRYRIANTPVNESPPGSQVSKVIESKNSAFPVGCYVVGYPGWQSVSHVTKEKLENRSSPYLKLPDFGPISRSAALGIFGMPGNTAYFGLLELCQPKAGEIVLVNGAAGAVGSLVCQIAKIKGCKVIGFAGSEEKVAWIKDLGVDFAFNYKTANITEAIKSVAPNGVDCYFDNVGGEFTKLVVPLMAEFGRISICGAISQYNNDSTYTDVSSDIKNPFPQVLILTKQLRIEGFIVSRWLNRWQEGVNQMKSWYIEGKIKYKETVTNGFDNMPSAFIGLFQGANTGKAVVRA